MRETNRMIELYQNLLFKLEKYGDLPTEGRKIMLSLGAFVRARAYLMEQQHLQAGDIVREQRINQDGSDNVQRSQSRKSTQDAAEPPHPHNE